MKNFLLKLLLPLFVFVAPHALRAQIITTIAGDGASAYTHDGVPATTTGLNYPPGVTVDTSGNIYIADQDNNAIRKIDTAGNIYTVAGTGTSGYTGDMGAATLATLNQPTNVNADRHGNLYISDEFNNVIRMINSAGIITTVAGNGTAAYSGDGHAATAAELWHPYRTIVDASGNLYIADQNNHVVRMVNTAGIISTIAGTGIAGFTATGPATAAELQAPEGLALDTVGNLFIADANDHVVFKVNTAGVISVFAGSHASGYSGDGDPATAALFSYPSQVIFDATGNLYISDFFDNVVREINAAGIIHTVAGNNIMGFMGDGGPATAAELNGPDGMAFDLSGNLVIADCSNYRIRKLSIPATTTAPITGAVFICIGDSSTLSDVTAGGAWSSSNTAVAIIGSATGIATGISAGTTIITYSVDTIYTTMAVTVNSSPSPIEGRDYVCVDFPLMDTTVLTDSTTGGVWSSSNTAVASIGSTTGFVRGLSLGTATISYTSEPGCYVATTVDVIICDAKVPLVNNSDLFEIFPNPAVSALNISSTVKITDVSITDLPGQTVFTGSYNTLTAMIDVSALPAGVYLIKINGAAVRKFVKE